MRIVFVNTVHEWGGVERYTADLAKGLAARGHEVHVVSWPGARLTTAFDETDVCVHPVDLGLAVGWHAAIGPLNHPLNWLDLFANPLRFRLTAELDALARTGPIDLLHAQHIKDKLWVGDYAKRHRILSAWTVHAPMETWMRGGAPGRVHRLSSANLDAVIATCQAALDDYAVFGIRLAHSEVIHNGVDLAECAAGNRGLMRAQLGLAEDDVAVLMLARPYEGKGIRVLLEAMSVIRSKELEGGSRIKAFVAGGSRHLAHYRQEVASSGLADRVVFLGHRDDIADLLAAADVATLPSFHEGLPYAISEAMAASLPVVATRVGGVSEMIEDQTSGYLIDSGDVAALAERFVTLANDRELREEMGANARLLAEERFSLRQMLDDSESLFAAVVRMRED